MKKPLFYLLFFSIISASSVAGSVELEEGWNTFSVSSEISESELTGSSDCDFRPVEGTDNFFFEQERQGDYEEVEELYPWKAYYGWVSDSCTLETINSEWDEDVDLNSGEWNLIKPPQNDEVLEEECDISKGSLESYYYTETGGNIIDLDNHDSRGLNKGIFVWPTNSCNINYESTNSEEMSLGNLYFKEGENILVSNGKDGDQERELSYEMYDGLIDGSFVSETEEEVERNIYVENKDTGESMEFGGSGEVVKNPSVGGWWGVSSESEVEEGSVYEMDGETEFKVEVRSSDSSEVWQEETFSFEPFGRGDSTDEDEDSDDEKDDEHDSSSEESLDYSYEVSLGGETGKINNEGGNDFSVEEVPIELWFKGFIYSDRKTISMEVSNSDGGSFSTDNSETVGDRKRIEIPTEDRNRLFGPEETGITTLKDGTEFEVTIDEGSEFYTETFTFTFN